MAREIKAYACEHPGCRKYYKGKASATAHEKKCIQNIKRATCATCIHDGRDLVEITNKPGHGEWKPYCEVNQRPEGKRIVFDCPSWIADYGLGLYPDDEEPEWES